MYEELSKLCNSLCLSDRDVNVLLSSLKRLDSSQLLPANVRDLRREEKRVIECANFEVLKCPIAPPVDKSDDVCMTVDSELELVFTDVLKISERLMNAEGIAQYLHFNYKPQMNEEDGRQIFDELWTSHWWRDEQNLLPSGSEGKILAVCMASDETIVTMKGRKMYPIYVFCGNYDHWILHKGAGWSLLGFQPIV